MMICICSAAWPVQSDITKFRSEFEFHIREKRCDLVPAGLSEALTS